MNPKLKANIITVIGKSGTGKTQWIKWRLKYLPRVILFDPMSEYSGFIECDNVEDLIEVVDGRSIFHVSFSDPRMFDVVCATAYFIGNLTLCIEEAQRIIPPKSKLPDSFEDVIYRGRKNGITLIFAAQRAKSIDIAVRSQSTEIISFKQTEHYDIEWINSQSPADISEIVKNLKPLHYIHIRNGKILNGRIPLITP